MADFKAAFAFVLQHEDAARAGKVTVDAGGRTRFGIAEKFHRDLPEEFFSGPAEDALLVRLVAAIAAPINVLAVAGLPPAARLREIGIRRLSAGGGVAKASLNHTFGLARDFLADGRSEPFTQPLIVPNGLNANMRRD